MTAKDTVRLETLAAELAIRDVLHRYALGLDQQDFALIASCFTDDVKAEYSGHPLSGVQGILELLRGAARFERTMHHVGTAVVTMRGDEADSQSYSIAYLVGRETDDECYLSLRAVRYIDKFRLVNGSWRIYERVHTVDWSSTAPAMLAPPLPPEFLAATLGS